MKIKEKINISKIKKIIGDGSLCIHKLETFLYLTKCKNAIKKNKIMMNDINEVKNIFHYDFFKIYMKRFLKTHNHTEKILNNEVNFLRYTGHDFKKVSTRIAQKWHNKRVEEKNKSLKLLTDIKTYRKLKEKKNRYIADDIFYKFMSLEYYTQNNIADLTYFYSNSLIYDGYINY